MFQLWWNSIDMDAEESAPLRPVTTQVVLPEQVPRVVQADGVHVRSLTGGYRGVADPLTSSQHQVMLLHVRLEPRADGELSPLPSDFNGFAFTMVGAVRVGGGDGSGDDGVLTEFGPGGLVLLPPGGDRLRLCNPTDARVELFVGLGRPHRKPYAKYVGYGGGLIHRNAELAEAAMAEYEADPKNYGRAATGTAAKPVDFSSYELVGGFQSNGGEMMERPSDVVARFKYA